MDVAFVIEALKFLQNVKEPMEGFVAFGHALASGTQATVYVIQKGAKLISYLITRAKKQKPTAKAVNDAPDAAPPVANQSDVAILVDINRRMLVDVSNYLEQQGIDADYIIVTNDPEYSDKIKFL